MVKEEYPKIRALAREHRADIFFGDEAGVRSDAIRAKRGRLVANTVVSTTGHVSVAI